MRSTMKRFFAAVFLSLFCVSAAHAACYPIAVGDGRIKIDWSRDTTKASAVVTLPAPLETGRHIVTVTLLDESSTRITKASDDVEERVAGRVWQAKTFYTNLKLRRIRDTSSYRLSVTRQDDDIVVPSTLGYHLLIDIGDGCGVATGEWSDNWKSEF